MLFILLHLDNQLINSLKIKLLYLATDLLMLPMITRKTASYAELSLKLLIDRTKDGQNFSTSE